MTVTRWPNLIELLICVETGSARFTSPSHHNVLESTSCVKNRALFSIILLFFLVCFCRQFALLTLSPQRTKPYSSACPASAKCTFKPSRFITSYDGYGTTTARLVKRDYRQFCMTWLDVAKECLGIVIWKHLNRSSRTVRFAHFASICFKFLASFDGYL